MDRAVPAHHHQGAHALFQRVPNRLCEPGVTVRTQQQDLRPGRAEACGRFLPGVARTAKGCASVHGDGDQPARNYASGREPSRYARSLSSQPVKLGLPGARERLGIFNAGTLDEKDLCLTQGSSSHYQVLGIPVTATEKDIKVAYRKAARLAHPDHGGDPAAFRRVTLAYETLIDAKRRADYDRSYGSTYSSPAGEEGAHFDAPAAGSRASANVRRPNTPRNTAADPPVYVPPFEQFGDGTAVPLIPAGVARQQVHGMPRKRGIFGAEARIQREMRTVQLITRQILTTIPAARLVNGLQSPADDSHIDHAVLAGYRLAIIGSMLLPPGAYAWNGSTLTHGNRSVAPPQLGHVVRRMQDIFPELNVTGWIVIHSTDGNLHQPVIDRHRRAPGGQGSGYGENSGFVEVVNAAGLARGLKQFLGSGPAPNTVNVPVLARLLRGMH